MASMENKKILVLGSGGREHAIVWALAQNPKKPQLFAAPGNAGIAQLAECINIHSSYQEEVLKAAADYDIDLVVIGPELPLAVGIADALIAAGYKVFGPVKAGARLESSKAFSKDFMMRHCLPTSDYDVCTTLTQCTAALSKRQAPYVIKADGLAAGKGVFICETLSAAMAECFCLLEDWTLGEAGTTLVIEDYTEGFEVTALGVTDGKTIRLLPLSQDHKRAYDGDKGPNTGGMGAYSPPLWGTQALRARIMKEIMEPTLAGLIADGINYCGIIYAGIMIRPDNSFSLLEYNVRLGDPEAQEVLPVFASMGGDFLEVIERCVDKELASYDWPCEEQNSKNKNNKKFATGVVLASQGYPSEPVIGREIDMGEDDGDTLVFHSGTMIEDGKLLSAGGRVLTCVGLGDTLEASNKAAYGRIARISLNGSFYRKDIGKGGNENE